MSERSWGIVELQSLPLGTQVTDRHGVVRIKGEEDRWHDTARGWVSSHVLPGLEPLDVEEVTR